MAHIADGLSPVLSELDELVDHLDGARARAASAFATEMFFFANVADLVQRRERERAARIDDGSRVDATQLSMREVYADIAAALQLSEYQVASRVSQAHVLVNEFATTLYEVSEGRLSAQHAQTIADAGIQIQDAGVRSDFERLALDMAGELTAAQLKDAVEGVVNRLDPEGTQERIREAVAERSVRMRSPRPGLGQLIVSGPLAEITGAYNRLTDIATEVQADNAADAAERAIESESVAGSSAESGSEFIPDDRSRAQIMADVALDLLLTSTLEGHGSTDERRLELGAIQATVNITIPAATLTGTAAGGAELTGAGAIDDATARQLAAGADAWRRLFIDPATGIPVTVDKRRPSKAQRRLLRARDERCRFPGCRRPARQSDIDHQLPWADGGKTALGNLAHLCERHHTVKHHTDWSVEHLPGGVLRWTAPTRRIHRTRPPGSIRFVSDRLPGRLLESSPSDHRGAAQWAEPAPF